MQLRVWAEFLPYDEVASPDTVALLERFQVGLCISVPPDGLGPPLANLLRAYENAGLEVALWLLLPRDEGYWPSERNAAQYAERLTATFAWARQEEVRIPWIAVDLELPLHQALTFKDTRGWRLGPAAARIAFTNLNARRFAQSVHDYRAILAQIHQNGARAICAAHDFVLEDLVLDAPVVQDCMETPVYDVPWDIVSTMTYNTMIAAFFNGTPADALWLEYVEAIELRNALGARAGLSVGLTGVGVLGDEPHYTRPEELAPDIAAAKAAGIDDIAIYNLEGILASPDPAAWFQVARETPPEVPQRTAWAERERRKRRRLARAFGWIRWLPGRR